ncbi:MAG TPA: hypothetical protein VNJ47_14190 [Nevskiales bacterium]|nr:hypothetical protein [Nevskiales bacterium]
MKIRREELYGLTIGGVGASSFAPVMAFSGNWFAITAAFCIAGGILFVHSRSRSLFLKVRWFRACIGTITVAGLFIGLSTTHGFMPRSIGVPLMLVLIVAVGMYMQIRLEQSISKE